MGWRSIISVSSSRRCSGLCWEREKVAAGGARGHTVDRWRSLVAAPKNTHAWRLLTHHYIRSSVAVSQIEKLLPRLKKSETRFGKTGHFCQNSYHEKHTEEYFEMHIMDVTWNPLNLYLSGLITVEVQLQLCAVPELIRWFREETTGSKIVKTDCFYIKWQYMRNLRATS